MIGELDHKKELSAYQPSQEITDFQANVTRDYDEGLKILQEPYVELNDRSVIEDENNGQLMFNGFVDESVDDPSQEWKWRGTRSKARNKGIAMQANIAQNYLLPIFNAQNDQDEVDQTVSEVMRDIVEWMAQPTVSNYQSSFMQMTFGMMTNPVTYMGAEYNEVYQTIKERTENGYQTREIIDEVLSGANFPVYSSSQVLITNAYERNIQKQRRIIKRRFCEYQELEAKYGDHPNWIFVRPGIKSMYNDEDGLFYDIKDEDHRHLVAEEIAYNRREDTEVVFVNGIYMGEENIEGNAIKHRDNQGAPKYNVVPFGFHRIGEHFFYYKSMMNTMRWDNMFYDAMSEVVMNRAVLETEMPVVVSGSEKIDSEVIFPNSVLASENPDFAVKPMLPNSNIVAGFNALSATETSMSEASVSDTIAGQLPEASQKAYSVAQAQANSRKLIGAIGKSLGLSVTMIGDLMKDIAINNFTTAMVDEVTGGSLRLKYRQMFVEMNGTNNSVLNKTIKFDESLIGKQMTEKEKKYMAISLLDGKDIKRNTSVIKHVNPHMFAKFKFYSKVDVEEMFTKNSEYWQGVLPNLKAILANDPYTDQQKLTRRLLRAFFQSEGDDMITEPQQAQVPSEMQAGVAEEQQVPSIAGNVIQ